ncbi:MAG TPA: Smr/MutS family protein [Patescibacteria group bacterium]|nr:Smr/MutS family protein [Patescibacteria group bacterium]
MDEREALIFAAQIGADIPEVDLHSILPDQALEVVEHFVYQSYQEKKKMGRVIYGGGTGRLGETVRDYLKKHPLVQEVVEESASCLVLL